MTKKTATRKTLPIVKFDVTKAALARMAAESKAFTVPTNPTEYKALIEQIALVRTTRTAVDKRRKEENKPILEWQRLLKSTADGLMGSLKEIEEPLLDLKKEYDDEKDRERREKAEAEEKRLAALGEAVTAIHAYRDQITLSHTADQIGELIETVESLVVDEEHYQERESCALAAKQETLRFLNTRLNEVAQKEKEDEQRRIDQIEIDRVQKEQDEQREKMAEQQRKLDEQQREIDEKREKAEKEESDRLQAIEDEAREKREAEEQAEFEAAEKVRLEAEDKANRKAAAAAKRKKAAYRKKLKADLPPARKYIEALVAIKVPVPKTEEVGIIIGKVLFEAINDATEAIQALEQDNE